MIPLLYCWQLKLCVHLCSVCLLTVVMKFVPQTHKRSFSVSLELLIQLESGIGFSRHLFSSYCQERCLMKVLSFWNISHYLTLHLFFKRYNILRDSILINCLYGIGMRCKYAFMYTNTYTHTCKMILCNHLYLVYGHAYKHFDYMCIWLFLMSLEHL